MRKSERVEDASPMGEYEKHQYQAHKPTFISHPALEGEIGLLMSVCLS